MNPSASSHQPYLEVPMMEQHEIELEGPFYRIAQINPETFLSLRCPGAGMDLAVQRTGYLDPSGELEAGHSTSDISLIGGREQCGGLDPGDGINQAPFNPFTCLGTLISASEALITPSTADPITEWRSTSPAPYLAPFHHSPNWLEG